MRRAAIRGFFRFVGIREPALLLHCQRVLAIPAKRQTKRTVDFLEREEAAALLAMPDLSTSIGRRDRNLLLVALQTGLRVSELIGLNIGDVVFGPSGQPHVRCRGKGRKDRATAAARRQRQGAGSVAPGTGRRPARTIVREQPQAALQPGWNRTDRAQVRPAGIGDLPIVGAQTGQSAHVTSLRRHGTAPRAESAARSSPCGLATSQRKRRTSTCMPTCRSRNRRWIGQGRWKCPRESTGPTTSCWRSSTPFDLFYADSPTGATRSVNGLGRNVGIKRLAAYR